jgi:hypothetical protein
MTLYPVLEDPSDGHLRLFCLEVTIHPVTHPSSPRSRVRITITRPNTILHDHISNMSGEPLLEHVPHAGSLDYSAASRPSIYELLAADELRGVVQPAFRYVLAVSWEGMLYTKTRLAHQNTSLPVPCAKVSTLPFAPRKSTRGGVCGGNVAD